MSATDNPALTADKSRTFRRTLRRFDRSPATIAARQNLANARRIAAETSAKVDAYIAPVFARFTFLDDEGNRIGSPERLYRCEDDALCAAFYAACDEAHRANGYDTPAGYCPALMAEHEVTKAERELLRLASEAFGIDFTTCHLSLRERALDLFLSSPVR